MTTRTRQAPSPSDHSPRAGYSTRTNTGQAVVSESPRWSPVLNPGAILRLQRTVGNQAVLRMLTSPAQREFGADHLVLQRKPADINGTFTLDFDIKKDKKKHVNSAAGRAKGPTRTKAINAQAKEKWVTPDEQLIGGHLFGAQFGGPDNESNVVPWREAVEDDFGKFEKAFQEQALKDARKSVPDQKLTLTIDTAATFGDRNDLKVTDEELNTAGWPATDPARAERKNKLDDVAEQFSGVPTTVKVKVTGLSTGEQKYEPDPAAIAPHYDRNAEAIKPAFVPYKRYQRNAAEPRVLNAVADWTIPRGQLFKDPLAQKLQHVGSRHGDQLGFAKNGEPDNIKALETKFTAHVADTTDTEQILGTYLGDDVIHYVNHGTKYWLCVLPNGNLHAAFVLSQPQYDRLIARGTVG